MFLKTKELTGVLREESNDSKINEIATARQKCVDQISNLRTTMTWLTKKLERLVGENATVETPDFRIFWATAEAKALSTSDWDDLEKQFPGVKEAAFKKRTRPFLMIVPRKK